ncbi:hypothetical protein IM792_09115 [Mucilaginibacter sp. JRF]|uniref:hypothetical protein n=1 Tax=Mucilaginibacter sp. JRF TaxID=2780088 RepID=UPI001882C9BD|nr:hypothetical protein [Mucilaginibacter sp. JRF]MBE9584603.1 hypothetical protein [Mucilaginibacter sp. JRF]
MPNQSIKDKHNYNQFTYIIPANILKTLEKLAEENKDFKNPERAFLKYLYVLNMISRDLINSHKDCSDYQSYRGIALNMQTLTKIFGTKNNVTTKIIKDLISNNLISRVDVYIPGCQSFKYKLCDTENLTFDSFTLYPKFDKISTKIIEKHNDIYYNDDTDLILYKSYMLKLSIYGLNDFIKDSCFVLDDSSPIISLMMGELNDETKYGYLSKNLNLVLNSLIEIHNSRLHISRKDPLSRVHTSLTNLKREARSLIRYDGKRLIEFDIRNSQPLLASILIVNYWKDKSYDVPEDVKKYIKDCESGVFYDYFMEKEGTKESERSQFKKRFFGKLFFSKVSKRKSKLTKWFEEKYPNCYKAICDIKGGVGSDSYKQFAVKLQRQEAQLIFDDVNMSLLKKGIPAFNIYDSILCLEEDADYVKECILKAFRRINLTPTLNIKNCTEDKPIEAVLRSISTNN